MMMLPAGVKVHIAAGVTPLSGQPMSKMRNAAQVNALGTRSISPAAQVRAVTRNVGLKK